MNVTVAYRGRSGLTPRPGGVGLSFAPNLRRDRVSFVGDLQFPLRFREAVSALHAVVVSDLKFKAKDRSAYQAYLKQVQERENSIRRLATQQARETTAGRGGRADPGRPAGAVQIASREVLGRSHQVFAISERQRPGPVPPAGAVRPGHHRRPGRALLRVLQQGRIELRLPDRGPRRVRRPGGGVPRHHERRLFAGRCTRNSSACGVSPHAIRRRSGRLRGDDRRAAAGYREEKIELPPSWLRGSCSCRRP